MLRMAVVILRYILSFWAMFMDLFCYSSSPRLTLLKKRLIFFSMKWHNEEDFLYLRQSVGINIRPFSGSRHDGGW